MTLRYSVRRRHVDAFYQRRVGALPPGSHVLDLGGTKIAKRGTFDIERYPVRTVYANLSVRKRPDVQTNAAQLPFDASQFDVVICAELLEHVPDPRPVLEQAHRVLKPGGSLLITAPFLYRIHGHPYDYGRYTDHYWREQLEERGFTHIEIERQGLFYTVLVDMSQQFVNRRWRRPWRWGGEGIFFLLRRWAQRQEQQERTHQDAFLQSFTTGFGIVATKQS